MGRTPVTRSPVTGLDGPELPVTGRGADIEIDLTERIEIDLTDRADVDTGDRRRFPPA
jgi:hypothetical protein